VDQLRQRSRHDPLIEEVEVRIRLGTGGQGLARQGEEVRFALDSLLEGTGFEPSVPVTQHPDLDVRHRRRVSARTQIRRVNATP
jgi:hypothetical protein